MKMQRGFGSVLKVLLLSTTLLAGTTGAQADLDDGDLDNTGQAPLPSGQFITPTFATGSAFSVLSPDIPEYTPAIGNYPNFRPGGAIASTLSPDGKTLAVMTSGYNVLDDARGNLVGTGAEFVILYDVSNPRAPRQKQTLRPPNTFVGLAFSPDGSALYVSGGNDDQVLIYKQANGTFAQTLDLWIVFFMVEVSTGLFQRFNRLQQTTAMFLHIDARVIVQILAVINRGFLDLGNCCIDFGNADIFVAIHLGVTRLVIQKPTGSAQIGQSVQIARMLAG